MLKIVIVDDEITALNGIRYIINKHCPDYEIVGAFEKGMEALSLIEKQHIDVVITDMKMSPIGGLEMIDRIKELDDQIYIVVLSAYSDFDFVRLAMKRGASDYLLKPCKPKDIIDLLDKFQRENDDKIETLRKRNHAKSFEQIFQTGIIENEEICKGVTGIALVSIDKANDIKIEKKLCCLLENHFGQDTIFVYVHNMLIVVVKHSTTVDAAKSYKEVYKNLKESNMPVDVAIVTLEECNGDIIKCYKSANHIIEFMKFNKIKGFLSFSDYREHIEELDNADFSETIDAWKLAKLIREKDPQVLLDKVSNSIESYLTKQRRFNPLQMKKDIIELIVKTESELKNSNLLDSDNMKQNIKSVQSIGAAENLAELKDIFKTAIFDLYSGTNEGKGKPRYIIEAIKYIENNYMNDISVKDVADSVYINIWHFSAQFKKHIGVSMSDYISKVRIKIAKELLKQPDLKVYQVAEMVGFSDAAYFSTVFKSIEKTSPKKYQSRIRGIK